MLEKVKIAYLHYRSYGDLVINIFCRKFFAIDSTDYVSIYLKDLLELLYDNSKNIITLDEITDKPAFINFKKSKIIEIINSTKQLKKSFTRIRNEFPDHLIFQDYKRWQQDLYFGTSTYAPKKLQNVYLSHISFYEKLGLKTEKPNIEDFKNDGIIRIFPYSSSYQKNIRPNILQAICDHLNFSNKLYEVIYLDGENIFEFKHNYSKIPKTFSNLISKLRHSNLNISCDSLPAHLSSFYNIRTLVIISEKSKYWLPLNSFSENNYITLESLKNNNYSNLFELIDRNSSNKI